MATYCEMARSNYFKVKDPDKFKAFLDGLNLELITSSEKEKLYGFIAHDGIPSTRYNEDTDEHDEVSFEDELSRHLVPGEVAVYTVVGNEGMRYMVGYAVAVNSHGVYEYVGLDEIYKKARKLTRKPKNITRAEY